MTVYNSMTHDRRGSKERGTQVEDGGVGPEVEGMKRRKEHAAA